MTKTLADVRANLPKRSQKVSGTDFLFIVNHSIKNDIMNDLYTGYTGEFRDTAEIVIQAGVYEYPIANLFEIESVRDSNKYKYLPLNFSGSTSDPDPRKKYKKRNRSVVFPRHLIDDGSIRVGETIYVDFITEIPEVSAETVNLPFSDFMQDLLFPVYVAGIAFYSFSDRKKLTDRDLAQNKYETAKLNVFSVF